MPKTIRVAHEFSSPAERVFAALDDHANMGKWLGAKIDLVSAATDGGAGAVRRVHLGPQSFDEQILERQAPSRIVYTIVRGLFPLSYHRGEQQVTALGPSSARVQWEVQLDSKIPWLASIVAAVLGFALRRGLVRLDRQLRA